MRKKRRRKVFLPSERRKAERVELLESARLTSLRERSDDEAEKQWLSEQIDACHERMTALQKLAH